jgi:predicted nucleotide-binding protein (sugar kinase/HSP70/actin superfamily)
MADVRAGHRPGERLLVPYIGVASEAVAAVFRGLGFDAECLPPPDAEALRRGQRHTSGKECLPMPWTLGSLLQRLERARPEERFVYLMPCSDGPCRFGVYNLLNQIVLGRLGWHQRLRIWSPKDTSYFDGLPPGAEMLVLAAFVTSDFLLQAHCDVRPVEQIRGASGALSSRNHRELLRIVETAARGDLTLGPSLWQVVSGRLFGLRALLERAGREFAAVRGPEERPLVQLTGEIYVRSVDRSNDFIIEKLEERGLRVRLSPMTEWLSYCGHVGRRTRGGNRPADRFSDLLRQRIEAAAFAAIAPRLGWPAPPTIAEALDAAGPYISDALEGEAVLTVGAPLHAWQQQQIDAVVNVSPLECMPAKIAEAQLHHVAERHDLLSLTLSFNGDLLNTAALDNFAFEVKARARQRQQRSES